MGTIAHLAPIGTVLVIKAYGVLAKKFPPIPDK
jgi:hypothetical protein